MKTSRLLILVVLSFLLVACGSSEDAMATAVSLTVEAQPTSAPEPTATAAPTNTPEPTLTPTAEPLPDIFVTQATKFLEAGEKLSAATGQGVNIADYRDLLSETKAAYSLVISTWPDNVSTDPLEDFDLAIEGWDLALDLWELKNGDYDNPVESDINGYLEFLEYAPDQLLIDSHPDTYIVKEYRGKNYLPFDENIGILFTVAGEYYGKGAQSVLLKLRF